MSILSQGTVFTRRDYPQSPVTIKEIITHKKESGKKVKLSEQIFLVSYDKLISKTETKRIETPMYDKDIRNQLSFGLWTLP